MEQQPVIQKNRAVSVIWTLPFIALCICGWLLYTSYRDAGTEIVIYFDDASGITPGKTQVISRGIPVGLVKKIHPDLHNKRIKTIIEIEQEAADSLVADTLFWVVRPQLSASSVQGLDTILSGSYIGIQPGVSKVEQYEFTGLDTPPPISPEEPGLHFQLKADVLGSVQDGSGIYFRNIEIGAVQQHRLDGEDSVLIDAFIRPDYVHLVREGSRFCNASGVSISGKLPNLKVHIESLASLLRGGILLYTPEQLKESPQVKNGAIFHLYPNYEAANYGIPMTLNLTSSEDIVEGSTKVMYRGLEAGFVKEIKFHKDDHRTVTAHILLDPRTEFILKEGTQFWLEKPEISTTGVKNLRLLLAGAYITFQPGQGAFCDHFDILPQAPPQKPLRPGKSYFLATADSVDFKTAAPVFFKNIQVGEVIDVDVSQDGQQILTQIFIYEKYLQLLSTHSIFWRHSGIQFEAGFDKGLQLSAGSLGNILAGGISFITPDAGKGSKTSPPTEETTFQLFNSYHEAVRDVAELQPPGEKITIVSDGSAAMSVGAPVTYKNVPIGEVTDLQLSKKGQSVLIEALITPQYRDIITPATRFFNLSGFEISGDLNGVALKSKPLGALLKGGIGCINPATGQPGGKRQTPYQLYDDLKSALQADRLQLTILLQDAQGLKTGSPVYYRNVSVGEVTDLQLENDLRMLTATVLVQPKLQRLFRKNTQFWVEKAEVDLSGIKNLENIIFGSYLTFLPGDGAPATTFAARKNPPYSEVARRDNFSLVLEASHLGSLSVGSPLYYREVKIGQVSGFDLSENSKKVDVFVEVEQKYAPIIRGSSRFWNISGVKIEGGLFSGVKVTTGSLSSIMQGGIALATPDKDKIGVPVATGHRFKLHDKPQPEWLDWTPGIILIEEEHRTFNSANTK